MSKKHCPIFILISLLLLSIFCTLAFSETDKDEYYRNKFKEKIDAQLARPAKITLSVSRQSTSERTIFKGTATNTSADILNNLVINGMLIRDEGNTGSHYQVIDIFEEQKVPCSLLPGESKNFNFQLDNISWTKAKVQAVIFVQEIQSPNREIYQAILVQ